jgi:hypothetical protein
MNSTSRRDQHPSRVARVRRLCSAGIGWRGGDARQHQRGHLAPADASQQERHGAIPWALAEPWTRTNSPRCSPPRSESSDLCMVSRLVKSCFRKFVAVEVILRRNEARRRHQRSMIVMRSTVSATSRTDQRRGLGVDEVILAIPPEDAKLPPATKSFVI